MKLLEPIQQEEFSHQPLKQSTVKDITLILFILLLVTFVGGESQKKQTTIISPLAHKAYAETIVLSEQDQITSYIKQVFGEDSDKALLLLSGNDKCHGENPSLNPKALHDNGGSKDYGLFQWNDYWNGFNKTVNNERYLFDYEINTHLAYRKFINDGHSFREWTAGNCLGI